VVRFRVFMEELRELRSLSQAHKQNPGGLGIKGPGVPYACDASQAPHASDDIMGRELSGFIDVQQSIHDWALFSRHRVGGGAGQFLLRAPMTRRAGR
jgi:hypothetical protein